MFSSFFVLPLDAFLVRRLSRKLLAPGRRRRHHDDIVSFSSYHVDVASFQRAQQIHDRTREKNQRENVETRDVDDDAILFASTFGGGRQ